MIFSPDSPAYARSNIDSAILRDVLTFDRPDGKPHRIEGPAVELLSLSGEISLEDGVKAAGVSGVVGDPTGAVWAGRFVRGENRVCITV